MQQMGLNEIREKYLAFFESKGHLRLRSFPLIPDGDPSLLLINSGMAPMKAWFSGAETPPRRRVTTCQKCIRTPDIERVGKTSRHGTYFEMLGNFSFGDYFKREATAWAWEFCTKTMGMPPEKLYISVFYEDDEAYDIWTKEVGIDPAHMVRLGREDNFWDHGSGPCGPCSEIYFDRGEKYGCGSPDCKVGCDCDRYVEFWNLVFTQFNNDGSGNYSPLAQKNIDTGMGLERLACIMQQVDNLFEVDTVRNIMKHVSRIAGVEYRTSEKQDVSLRVITDHIRSTTFMVCDGVIPSNEGRGYVLRRLLRRAARHGKLLGIDRLFLSEVCRTVIEENKTAYPELLEKVEYIHRVIDEEEKRFHKTIDSGLGILSDMISKLNAEGKTVLSGEDSFRLNDTFGFPVDLTVEILAEHGLQVDRKGFDEHMAAQKKRAREAHLANAESAWAGGSGETLTAQSTEFVGYADNECDATLLDIVKDGEPADSASAGDTVVLVFDRTPFYAESGGQVGDMGAVTSADGAVVKVTDTKKAQGGQFLHIGTVLTGRILPGAKMRLQIDVERRRAVMRAHSATHLLQKALRAQLGAHVQQAGSYVEPDRARFDFSHFAAMTDAELTAVESEVNRAILEGMAVDIREMPIDEAKKLGAMALFGEKYGDSVRVVRLGDYSTEFCGGTHLDNTAKAGLFKILSESSVAAGVRRIEAVTGSGVLKLLSEKQMLIDETAEALKTGEHELARRAKLLGAEAREQAQEIERLNAKLASSGIAAVSENAVPVGAVRVAALRIEGLGMDALRSMGDMIRERYPDMAAVLASPAQEKIHLVAVCGKDAVSAGAHAGNLIRETAKLCGGGGGGRPDSATAGGRDIAKLDEALNSVVKTVESMLK